MNKVTLIVFWSTQCKDCRNEIENLEKIYKKYNKLGFSIIRINTDAQNELLKNLIGKNQPKWIDVGLKNQKNIILDGIYNIKNTPFSFLIDSTGKIIAKNLVDDELTEKINEIMKAK